MNNRRKNVPRHVIIQCSNRNNFSKLKSFLQVSVIFNQPVNHCGQL